MKRIGLKFSIGLYPMTLNDVMLFHVVCLMYIVHCIM